MRDASNPPRMLGDLLDRAAHELSKNDFRDA